MDSEKIVLLFVKIVFGKRVETHLAFIDYERSFTKSKAFYLTRYKENESLDLLHIIMNMYKNC
jgi:hypothetical protein